MTFQRTRAGLTNLHVFAGVDAVVFVEGGSALSLAEVKAGRYDSESSDIAFWQKCFSVLRPTMTLQFRAIGSKPTLLGIAKEIVGGAVSGVYVAMDRDFDHLLGGMISSPRVLYTHGYSWENDVWSPAVIEDVFYTLCGVCRNTIAVSQSITASFEGFARDLRWPTYADFICVTHGIGLLPRQSVQRVINVGGGSAPTLNRDALRRCVRDAKSKRQGAVAAISKVKIEPLIDCCGHLIGAFGYTLLVYLFKKFCRGVTYPRHLVDAAAIDKFFEKIRLGHFASLRAFYDAQLTA